MEYLRAYEGIYILKQVELKGRNYMTHNLSSLSQTLASGKGEIIPVNFREKGISVLIVHEVRHILNAPENIIG